MRTASIIADYIRHNRSLGKRYVAEQWILSAFLGSIGDVAVGDIRPAMITRFVNREGTHDETIRKKHRVLSSLFRYAVTRCQLKTSPMPVRERRRRAGTFTPYIYSAAELKRLLESVPAATGPRSGIDADTQRMFMLLLYGAGLRRGEALRLKIEDIDHCRLLLHIRGTKFFKTRMVPLSANLNTALKAFIARRCGSRSRNGSDMLFRKRDGAPLTDSAIGAAFRRARTVADIRRDGGPRNQPRLHDLRHSAAVHRVTAWYRSGADVNDLLPRLATYLGHKNLSGTQRYLTMTDELLAEASRRFEAFAQVGHHD